jgi:hypothetical protein
VVDADAIPIFIRLVNSKNFEPGPVNLGKWGKINAFIAVSWVCFITVRSSKPVLLYPPSPAACGHQHDHPAQL